jgi:hypothetical protein
LRDAAQRQTHLAETSRVGAHHRTIHSGRGVEAVAVDDGDGRHRVTGPRRSADGAVNVGLRQARVDETDNVQVQLLVQETREVVAALHGIRELEAAAAPHAASRVSNQSMMTTAAMTTRRTTIVVTTY